MKNTIKKDKMYSLNELVDMGAFHWIKSFQSYRKIIELDMANDNILKSNTMGDRFSKRYMFKGENVLKFIQKVEAGGYHFK